MKNNKSMMVNIIFDQHYKMLPVIMKEFNEERFMTTFFGGEPLLNWKLIVHAIEKIKNDPVNAGFIIPTNGLLLTPEKIIYLQKHNVNLSLSFDGLWNKIERLDNQGEPTFERYMRMFLDDEWENLFQSCKIMVPPKRGNISLVENYEFFLNDIDNAYPDFTLVRDKTWTGDDVHRFEVEIKQLADTVIRYISAGVETMPGIFSLYMLDTIMADRHGKRPFSCFAGCHGAGFMPNGFVYPCARFGSHGLRAMYNSIGGRQYHKLPESVTNPKKFAKCQACELYTYCNSGCTFEQYTAEDEFGDPVDNVCKLFKACYEQAFRITHVLKYSPTFKNVMEHIIRRIENG